MNAILILAISLSRPAEIPPLCVKAATWSQSVECLTMPVDANEPSERFLWSETIEFLPNGSAFKATHSRRLMKSWIGSDVIPVDEKPSPLVYTVTFDGKAWPVIKPLPNDRFGVRLARAMVYVPLATAEIPGERGAGIPPATYEASVHKRASGIIEVVTVFREVDGLAARGTWTFLANGKFHGAQIEFQDAFAPGGDGSKCFYNVTITANNE